MLVNLTGNLRVPDSLALQGFAITLLANAFLMAFCAVITQHGVAPPRQPGQIYVANHTTVIDVILLLKTLK